MALLSVLFVLTEISDNTAWGNRWSLIFLLLFGLSGLVTLFWSAIFIAPSRPAKWIALALSVLGLCIFGGYFTSGGDGIVASTTLPDGTQVELRQRHTGSMGEPYYVELAVRRAGREWAASYIDHQDIRWWFGSLTHDPQMTTVVVRRFASAIAVLDLRTGDVTLTRRARSPSSDSVKHTDGQTGANKTDAGNGSEAICRVSNVLRSPSPDPRRSAKKRSSSPMIRYFTAILATTVALILPSEAANDSTFLDYLGRTSLKVEDCVSRDPSELFLVIAEREKLGYSGTPSHEESVVEAFYQNYTKVLRAHNDFKHVEVAKARAGLQELFYSVTDRFEDLLRWRSYITHARVDAYVEHIISMLADGGFPGESLAADLSVTDVAGYVRTSCVLRFARDGAAILTPDWDGISADVTRHLRTIARSPSPHESRALHYLLAQFADTYPNALHPRVK
jgi:hypothetical protein